MSLEKSSKLFQRYNNDHKSVSYVFKYVKGEDEGGVLIHKFDNNNLNEGTKLGQMVYPREQFCKEITLAEYVALRMTNGVIHEEKV